MKAGSKLINYSVDTNFYYYYLLQWESCLNQLNSKDASLSNLIHENSYKPLYEKLREPKRFLATRLRPMCCYESNSGLNPDRPHGRYIKFFKNKNLNIYKKAVGKSPDLSCDNYTGYMDNLVRLMHRNSIPAPASNTQKPYIYKIDKIGFTESQNIFLLYFDSKIILYGLSKTTFNMLDKFIDESDGSRAGKFKGKLQKDKIHYIGIWEFL